MPRVRSGIIACVLLAAHPAARAWAGENSLPTRLFLVKNSAPADAGRRRLTFTGQELLRSSIDIVGDPTSSGATMRVRLSDGDEQCFTFPASGWFPTGNVGFRYTNTTGPGVEGFVVIKKEALSGDFLLKLKLTGGGGPITVVPAAGLTGFDLNFAIGGGDQYCAGGPTPSGSAVTDQAYKVQHVAAPAACGVTSCAPGGAS